METLVELTRGKLVESVHRGAIALMDATGVMVASVGNIDRCVYMRSSAKPLQVVPMIEGGAADRFRFSERQLAVMVASHSGEPIHLEQVRAILATIGLDEEALACGAHWPSSAVTAAELRRKRLEPTSIHNNCSGKHAGMLALAVHAGFPVDGYTSLSHPVQDRILRTIAEFADVTPQDVVLATDGCGVPVFGLPLWRGALAYARLVDAECWPPERRRACDKVVAAMRKHPDMVAGPGRLSTEIMRVAGDRLIAKGGAEGYFAVGIRPRKGKPGLGLTMKIEDGDLSGRARGPAVLNALHQLGLLHEDDLAGLVRHWPREVRNHRGDVIGELRTPFRLESRGSSDR